MTKKTLIVGGTILSLLVAAGIAIAQTKPSLRRAAFGERRLAFMTAALDLTDEQVQQIKQIHAAQQPKYQAFRAQMKSAMTDFQALVATDNFDEAKVRAAIAQRQQLMQDMMVEHAREMNSVYKILTPEQRTKAIKMFQNFGPMGGHRGHMGQGGAAPDGM